MSCVLFFVSVIKELVEKLLVLVSVGSGLNAVNTVYSK